MGSSDAEHDPVDLTALYEPLGEVRAALAMTHRASKTWESRTGELTRLVPLGEGTELVLKEYAHATTEEPRAVVEVASVCASHARSMGEGSFTPDIVAWGLSPAYVLMRSIPGRDLHHVLVDTMAEGRPDAFDRVSELVGQTGEVLARFHEAMEQRSPRPASRGAYGDRWIRFAKRLVGDGWNPDQTWSVIDPAAQNFRVDPNGKTWFIDLPDHDVRVPVEFDLARLIFRLRYTIDDERSPSRRRVDRRTPDVVRTAVLAGYRSRRPDITIHEPALHALILIEIVSRSLLRLRPTPDGLRRFWRELRHALRTLRLVRAGASERPDPVQR